MSKSGHYIGGGTIRHADPKRIEDIAVSPFEMPPRDIIAEIRKARREEKAKLAAEPKPNSSSPIVGWSADFGMVNTRYRPTPRKAK